MSRPDVDQRIPITDLGRPINSFRLVLTVSGLVGISMAARDTRAQMPNPATGPTPAVKNTAETAFASLQNASQKKELSADEILQRLESDLTPFRERIKSEGYTLNLRQAPGSGEILTERGRKPLHLPYTKSEPFRTLPVEYYLRDELHWDFIGTYANADATHVARFAAGYAKDVDVTFWHIVDEDILDRVTGARTKTVDIREDNKDTHADKTLIIDGPVIIQKGREIRIPGSPFGHDEKFTLGRNLSVQNPELIITSIENPSDKIKPAFAFILHKPDGTPVRVYTSIAYSEKYFLRHTLLRITPVTPHENGFKTADGRYLEQGYIFPLGANGEIVLAR